MPRSSTVWKPKQSKTNMWVDSDMRGLFHWMKHYYGLWTHILARNNGLKLKWLNDGFVSYKHAAFHFTRC